MSLSVRFTAIAPVYMTQHQKRLSAPDSYPIERKSETFTVKIGAGPHGESGVPLLIFLRDVLGYADTMREARYALNQRSVLVNGDPVSDEQRPVGLFDILTFTEREEHYRVFPARGGRLELTPIDASDAGSRLGKITGKQQVSGGDFQFTLHDGTNITQSDQRYDTKDSVIIDNQTNEVVKHLPYRENALAIAVDGEHSGDVGRIDEITVTPGSSDNIVSIQHGDSGFETIEEYVFVIDKKFSDLNDTDITESMTLEANGGNPEDNPHDIIDRLERDETDDPQSDYVDALESYRDRELMPEDIAELYRLKVSVQDKEQIDISKTDDIIDEYFSELIESGRTGQLQMNVEAPKSPDEIADGLNRVEEVWNDRLGEDYDAPGDGLSGMKKNYLLSVRQSLV